MEVKAQSIGVRGLSRFPQRWKGESIRASGGRFIEALGRTTSIATMW